MAHKFTVIGGRYIVRSLHRGNGGAWTAVIRDKVTGESRKKSAASAARALGLIPPGDNQRKSLEVITAWLEDVIREEERGDGPDLVKLNVAWMQWLETKVIRPPTRIDYGNTLSILMAFFDPSVTVDRVRFRDVQRFVVEQRRKGRTDVTIRKKITHLRGFYRWAIRMRYAREDPTEGIRIQSPKKRAGRALTEEEARRLLAIARKPVVMTLKDDRREWTQSFGGENRSYRFIAYLLAMYSGLRRRAVLALRWEHVHLSDGWIDLPASLAKSKRDLRVPIHPVLGRELQRVLGERLKKLAEDGQDIADVRTERVVGRKIADIKRGMAGDVRRAGLPPTGMHDLRRTCASWLDAAGCGYSVLRALLGHAPGDVTMGYVHVAWEYQVSAMRKLPDLLRDPPTSEEPGKVDSAGILDHS